VTVKLLDTEIYGSGFTITVRPGEISSLNTFSTVDSDELKLFEAGTTYLFDIQLVDIYGNYLIDGTHG
jgi:hypothetical protein